ncbi:hypothetical protein [Neomicrococcus aestuarii]|uniref:Bacteriocin biosynthesis cyclodehydratase domain-containing protein n=1 Tax=Neomicrococcus aestuarii TaxID=556325 RepID=A0A1L2ZN75_9MICC|nr:hypothetical protein [Neomicrococcus aestuarii]APF40853.1 hypothetical protein BHE16_07305 [Neomicrococcus aestuarii]MBB5512620.1 bacteriocin biosynthesis cyclodehydratase domain-containing protein [Neomicrococcus aestuarii]
MTLTVEPHVEHSPDLGEGLVLNPALKVIRASNDEVIVRHGSRGRSTQRFTDPEANGVLGNLVELFHEPYAVESLSTEHEQILARELAENGVLVPQSQLRYAFLVAGLGRPVEEVTGTYAIIGEGVLAQEVARSLQDALPSVQFTSLSSVSEISDDPDFIIAVADTPNLGFFFDVNEYALTTKTRWHAAYVDGPEAIVGPLYDPEHTGCFHDYDVLDESGRSLRVDHMYSKFQPEEGQAPEHKMPLFLAQLVAGYLTLSVVQDALREGSYLEGEFIRLDTDRLEVIKQQLSRIARCPACMENRPDLRHPFV